MGLCPTYGLWPNQYWAEPEPRAKPNYPFTSARRGKASPHIRRHSRGIRRHSRVNETLVAQPGEPVVAGGRPVVAAGFIQLCSRAAETPRNNQMRWPACRHGRQARTPARPAIRQERTAMDRSHLLPARRAAFELLRTRHESFSAVVVAARDRTAPTDQR